MCDTPARSFVCGIRGHNSLNGCSKCYQKATSISRVTVYSTSTTNLRTDEDFKNRVDRNFHISKFQDTQMLIESAGIKMITEFPLDVMHLVDLGVARKML